MSNVARDAHYRAQRTAREAAERRAEYKAAADEIADFFKYRPISRKDLAIICKALSEPEYLTVTAARSIVKRYKLLNGND